VDGVYSEHEYQMNIPPHESNFALYRTSANPASDDL